MLQDPIMLTIAEITSKLGVSLRFVEPNDKVKAFLVWLESDKRDQMSLVDHLESQADCLELISSRHNLLQSVNIF